MADRTGFRTALGLVMVREIRLRTFSRAALLSIGFSVLIIAGLVFVPKIIGGAPEAPKVAVVGAAPEQVQRFAELLPGNEVVAGVPGTQPSEDLPYVVTLSAGSVAGKAHETSQLPGLDAVLAKVQVAVVAETAGTAAPSVSMSAVTDDSEQVARALIGYLVVVLLFGQIVGMSSAVTQALMEEKGNRVIDLLLPKVRPLALLWGKVAGAGLAGLLQTAVMAASALLLLLASGDRQTTGIVLDIGWVVLLWYVLGFLFMGVIYGGIGAMMRKPDDVPSVTVPLQLINMLTFLVGVVALQNPGAAWVDTLAKVPPFSAILVPLQVITLETTAMDVVISAAVILGCAVLLSLAGARLFSLAVRTDSPADALRRFLRPSAG